MGTPESPTTAARANATYYFQTGVGRWRGMFGFTVSDWRTFWRSPIGVTNRCLVLAMAAVTRLVGESRIDSLVEGFPDQDEAGVATNIVRISKAGVTLYSLNERYVLKRDGRQVWVQSKERFGPLPFLFNVSKQHPAEILNDGRRAIYYIPLLGAQWTGTYDVRGDRQHIDSRLVCAWAEAREVIDRVG